MDYVIRGLAKGGKFRIFGITCRETIEEIRRLQGLCPVASAALGRALAGVGMLASELKTGRISIQINGGGPLGEVFAEGDAEGNLRGTVKNPCPDVKIDGKKLPVGLAVGRQGFLSVVKDLGLREVYQSSVKLISGEIAEDLAYYLTLSEQIPSAVSLGVLVDTDGKILQAGGFIVQKMPDASEEEVIALEKKLKAFPQVTTLLSQGKTPEEILNMIFEDWEILLKREIRFRCLCTKERVERTLIALGKEELEKTLKEGKDIEVVCHFCRKTYKVSLEEIKRLLEEINSRKEIN